MRLSRRQMRSNDSCGHIAWNKKKARDVPGLCVHARAESIRFRRRFPWGRSFRQDNCQGYRAPSLLGLAVAVDLRLHWAEADEVCPNQGAAEAGRRHRDAADGASPHQEAEEVGRRRPGEVDGAYPNREAAGVGRRHQDVADGDDPNQEAEGVGHRRPDGADGGDPNRGAEEEDRRHQDVADEADQFLAVPPSGDDHDTMADLDTSDPNNSRTGR